MSTIFPFTPSNVAPYEFQPTLDGAVYNVTVPWLLFGARYYLNLVALDGTQLLYTAIAGSPSGVQLQSIAWANGIVSATTATPHGYKVATTVALTISGATPAGYNGLVDAFMTGPNSFSYMLAANPGPATVFGNASYDINLIGGVPNENGAYFTSTLVFRQQAQQFEVSP